MPNVRGFFLFICLASGCAQGPGSSPAASHLGTAQVVGLGAGTALGAAAGDRLAGAPGAVIGGAAGLAAAAAVNNAFAGASQTQPIDQIRREERLKIMQRYWYEHTAAGPDGGAGEGSLFPGLPNEAPLFYPAGLYDGIRFAPRAAAEPGLIEPFR
jgi:hypothetical protein